MLKSRDALEMEYMELEAMFLAALSSCLIRQCAAASRNDDKLMKSSPSNSELRDRLLKFGAYFAAAYSEEV